jgi:uncharacterized protein YodC (DUF2158 family)
MNAHASFGFSDVNGFPDVDAFALGDIVTLLTGSPLFTVIGACECGGVEIAFYDDHNGLVIESFPEEALVHWDGEE